MRILHVVNLGYPAGGAEAIVAMLVDEFRSRGDEVEVLASTRQGRGQFSRFHVRGTADGGVPVLTRLFSPRVYRQTRRVIRDFRPDLVHFHTVGFFSPSVFLAARGVPAIMTVHGAEPFTRDFLPWILAETDFRSRPYAMDDLTWKGRLRYAYIRLLERTVYLWAMRGVRRFVAPSDYLAGAVAGDVGQSRVVTVNNAIDLPQPQPLTSGAEVLYAGRVEVFKGVRHLVEAFPAVRAAVPEARLRIAGDGAERPALEELVASLGLQDAVTFLGWCDRETLRSQYAAATVVVVPSTWPEVFGIVSVEALATGRPVVASAVGGVPEVVEDGVTGRLVPPADPAALAEAIVEVLADRALLEQMSARGPERARDFDAATFFDRMSQIYRAEALA